MLLLLHASFNAQLSLREFPSYTITEEYSSCLPDIGTRVTYARIKKRFPAEFALVEFDGSLLSQKSAYPDALT